MEQYAVVHSLNKDIEKINTFRRKYDPMWQVISPHITLVSPFSDISEDQIIKDIETVTINLRSFPIRLRGPMKSTDDYLFLLMQEDKQELIDVQNQLSSKLHPDGPKDTEFMPHLNMVK